MVGETPIKRAIKIVEINPVISQRNNMSFPAKIVVLGSQNFEQRCDQMLKGGLGKTIIHAVITAAFARPETAGRAVPEATLVDELRASEAWLPPLSLVASDDGEITGHVVCTRGYVGSPSAESLAGTSPVTGADGGVAVPGVPVLGLGPLSVRPDRQRRGIGTALVHAVLGAADALGEPLVALLGDPGYYGRFGFRPSADYRVTPPDPGWDAYFQVRVLSGYDAAVHGTFSYAGPFDRV